MIDINAILLVLLTNVEHEHKQSVEKRS